MKHVWKPESYENDDGEMVEPTISGTVELNLPKYTQRLRYLKDAKVKISAEGDVEKSGEDALEQTIFAIETGIKHIEKIDLTVIETGKKIVSVEEMEHSPECEDALTSIGFLVLNGPALGKN